SRHGAGIRKPSQEQTSPAAAHVLKNFMSVEMNRHLVSSRLCFKWSIFHASGQGPRPLGSSGVRSVAAGGIMGRLSRRQFGRALAASAATLLSAPAARAQKDQQTLRFVAQANLKIFDPVWTTAYTTRN